MSEERGSSRVDAPNCTPEQASGEPGGDSQTTEKPSSELAHVSSHDDGASLKETSKELNKEPVEGDKSEDEGGGEAHERQSADESGSGETNKESSKEPLDRDESEEEGEGGGEGKERRRRRSSGESSSGSEDEDKFADAVDDLQNVTYPAKISLQQPSQRDQEGGAQSKEGAESADASGEEENRQEQDLGQEEETGQGTEDWTDNNQESDNAPSYDNEHLKEEEVEDGSEAETENSDHKEDEVSKDSPMYVPKGIYFQHDSRSEEQEDEKEPERPQLQSRSEVVKKWEHDLYNEKEQRPRTQWERDRDRKFMDEWENRNRSQGPRSRGTLGEYIPPRGRRDGGNRVKYNGHYGSRDRQSNRVRDHQHVVEDDFKARDKAWNSGQDHPRRRDSAPWNRDQKPSSRRVIDETRKSHKLPRNHAREQIHTSPSDQAHSTNRQAKDDCMESATESPSVNSNSKAPKSLFKEYEEAPKSFSNSRVFTLDQRSQRVMVKELESPPTGSSQHHQPSLRVRKPLGRGRGIIKRGGDSTPGASTASGNKALVTSPASEVKEIAPFDQRTPDEENTRQATTIPVSFPCKTRVSSSHPPLQAPLVPAQEEKGSPKKSKEESILGEPPPSVAVGKPKRYSSQRQKAPSSTQEEVVDEPSQLDYSLSGPTPWMVPFHMMDPASAQRQAMAMMHSQQQFMHQMAYYQQHLRLMHDYQQGTPPAPPPVGPHNPQYPIELSPQMMPYLPPIPVQPVPTQPIPAQPIPTHPDVKVPLAPVAMGAEGFTEQGGLFIPGINPDQQRFYHSQGAVLKHSQAIPIVPPGEHSL